MSHTVRVYRKFEFDSTIQRQGIGYVISKIHAMVEALGGTWVEDGPHHGVLGGQVHFDRHFVFTSKEDASLAELLLNNTAPLTAKKKEFTVFWRDGKREVQPGDTIADAFNKAGYGAGALGALDFYEPGDSKKWEWNKPDGTWKQKEGHGLIAAEPAKEEALDDGLQVEASPMPVLPELTVFRAAHSNGPGCGMSRITTPITIEDVVCEYNIKAREAKLPTINAEEAALNTEIIKELGLYHISFKGSAQKCKLWVVKAAG